MTDFNEAFSKTTGSLKSFHDALEIVDTISHGKAWLIGGMVYRGVASYLYKTAVPNADFDIIFEQVDLINLPKSWSQTTNRFGNAKVTNGIVTIDVIPITNIHSIKTRNLEPTIENFLSGTPLTIQSIAYDISSHHVIGDAGKQALANRTVAVYNVQQAKLYEKRYNISINQLVNEKASSLDFTPILL